jgi:hypothetical protein
MRRKKRLKNEWAHKRPTIAEIRDSQKLARKVSKKLLALMEAKPVE